MKVVVSTPDVVGARMAGPGIRAYHFAEELAKHFDTTLVAKVEEEHADFPIVERSAEAFRDADVVISQSARDLRFIRRDQKWIADLFDPQVLELRELYGNAPSFRQRIHVAAEWWRLTRALRRADLLICATPQQRRFYDRLKATDTQWLEIPFGVEQAPHPAFGTPLPVGEGVSAVIPLPPGEGGAERRVRGQADPLVIWGGGTWEWLDPAIAVDAIVKLNREGTKAHLLFLGRSRPNADLIDRRREDRFDGLLARGGAFVSANETWVPYRERLSWLRRGKVAIMLHRPTAEAACSIRTRLFDAIAVAIPVIATKEGFAAELVEREGLGIVVPPSDVEAVAGAVRRLLHDDEFHAKCVRNLERIRPRFAWDAVTKPLVEAVSRWQKREN
jgi:glycosyltransferase involved in cell wall biosynthesis